MKSKFNITNQLKESLMKETLKEKDKFSRADTYLAENKVSPTTKRLMDEQREKIVRDGFSMLESEWSTLEEIRFKVTEPGFFPTKSEVFRAMLSLCKGIEKQEIISAIKGLKSIKQGRKPL
jgi:hypothetical protein